MAASTSKPPSKPVQALKRYERQIKKLPLLLVNRRCFCSDCFLLYERTQQLVKYRCVVFDGIFKKCEKILTSAVRRYKLSIDKTN